MTERKKERKKEREKKRKKERKKERKWMTALPSKRKKVEESKKEKERETARQRKWGRKREWERKSESEKTTENGKQEWERERSLWREWEEREREIKCMRLIFHHNSAKLDTKIISLPYPTIPTFIWDGSQHSRPTHTDIFGHVSSDHKYNQTDLLQLSQCQKFHNTHYITLGWIYTRYNCLWTHPPDGQIPCWRRLNVALTLPHDFAQTKVTQFQL